MTEAVTHHTMDRAPAPVWPPASQTQWTRDGGVHRSSDAFRTHRLGVEAHTLHVALDAAVREHLAELGELKVRVD